MTALDEATAFYLDETCGISEHATALEARAELAALREHLATAEKLLEERNRLLAAIPECPTHCTGCVPHALEWVESAKASRTTGTGLAMLAVREQEERLLAVEQAVAALQKPRTCATCRWFESHLLNCANPKAPSFSFNLQVTPENFGCIHHAPRPLDTE